MAGMGCASLTHGFSGEFELRRPHSFGVHSCTWTRRDLFQPQSSSRCSLLSVAANLDEKFSKCGLGNDFEIVKVDRLHTPMSRTVDTPFRFEERGNDRWISHPNWV